MQLRNGLVCQEQCGAAGLSGVGEGSQVGAAQVLGVVDEQKRKAAAKGCWMHVAKGMDGPAEPTAKVQLALAEWRCMEQSRAVALGAHALYDVIKQQGFPVPAAAESRKQVPGWRCWARNTSSLTDCWVVVRKYSPCRKRSVSVKGEMR